MRGLELHSRICLKVCLSTSQISCADFIDEPAPGYNQVGLSNFGDDGPVVMLRRLHRVLAIDSELLYQLTPLHASCRLQESLPIQLEGRSIRHLGNSDK